MSLQIIKAKPNPAGKDRIGNFSPQSQLAGEWVDIQNIGSQPVDMANFKLYHWAYKIPKSEWEIVTDFQGILPIGEIVRIHAGQSIPLNQLHSEDIAGAQHHVFSEKGYVWNNDNADYPSIWNVAGKKWIDQSEYDSFPEEGRILQRVNNKLI